MVDSRVQVGYHGLEQVSILKHYSVMYELTSVKVYKVPMGIDLSGLDLSELWVTDEPGVRTDTRGRVTPGLIRLTRPPYDSQVFYLFHELCWDRLVDHYQYKELDLERLYSALQHMPLPDDCNNQPVGFELPTLEQLMYAPKPRPKEARRYHGSANPTDCFEQLSLELRKIISIQISTREVLDLRLASRAMTCIFASPFFWQTRFDINGERGHLSTIIEELTAEERQNLDWRLLYHCTCNLWCSADFFEANIEMWERLRWLRDMIMEEGGSRLISRIANIRRIMVEGLQKHEYRNRRHIAVSCNPGLCLGAARYNFP
ncbi:uncharacterized protein BDV14DRAFT_197616 [Aspergillus stella-maris]|uniref:uncharacterized protein n=1 Tax=Aspergillus stella-maris TaxID=1810926 RepID=UPI003CCE3CCD